MNVKRYLKKQARKDQQAIIDADDGKTLRALGIDHHARKQKNRMLPSILGIAGAAVSIVLIVCVIVFYPIQNKVEYIDANHESRESTLSEMNSELHDFTFEIDESRYLPQIARTYDSVSNDLLYYTISLKRYDSLVKLELITVCNPNFEYKDFEFSQTPNAKSLDQYDILYDFRTKTEAQFGFELLSGIAEIDGEKDTIYIIMYEELLVQPEPAFFDIIQTIVKPVK